MSNLSKKNLTEIVKLIKKKEIKSEELTQSFVKNINNDKKLNAFISKCTEEALKKAKKLDDAGTFQTLKGYRENKNLEAVKAAEDHAKVILKEYVAKEVNFIADVFENNLIKEGFVNEDDYFIKRKLYPNVDFYSGIIYRAMGIPTNMFTVMFALGRLPGWLAHWREMILNPNTRINRPRQIYTGNIN